jgi:hypothetical protein
MKLRKNLKKISSTLVSLLRKAGYEISQATGGWHLHKGNIYYGNLHYQGERGFSGSALQHLPSELLEQLKNLTP